MHGLNTKVLRLDIGVFMWLLQRIQVETMFWNSRLWIWRLSLNLKWQEAVKKKKRRRKRRKARRMSSVEPTASRTNIPLWPQNKSLVLLNEVNQAWSTQAFRTLSAPYDGETGSLPAGGVSWRWGCCCQIQPWPRPLGLEHTFSMWRHSRLVSLPRSTSKVSEEDRSKKGLPTIHAGIKIIYNYLMGGGGVNFEGFHNMCL